MTLSLMCDVPYMQPGLGSFSCGTMNTHLYVTDILTPYFYLSVYESIYALFQKHSASAHTANYSMCYLYCCTVHLVDSIIITKPTNALIVCNLFLNHFFKTLSLLLFYVLFRLLKMTDLGLHFCHIRTHVISTCRVC